MTILTSDELGAGLVPADHQLRDPGERGPQRDVLGSQARAAATKIRPGCIFSESYF